MKKLILLLLILTTKSFATDSMSSSLENLVKKQQAELEVLQGTPSDLTSDDYNFINLTIFSGDQHVSVVDLVYKTFQSLRTQDRVRRLTPELRQKLNIDKVHCSTKKRCSELVAVYLPLSNYVLVDFDQINRENRGWFYHEIIHAFQYTYRFPWDMDMLYRLSQRKTGVRIKPEQLVDYIRFYYEAQANWYTLKLTKDPIWLNEESAFWKGLEKAWKIPVGLVSFPITMNLGRQVFEGWLPYVDQNWNGGDFHHGNFELKELVALKSYHNANPAILIDLGFHEHFIRAIELAYFGELEFLYSGDDQQIYRDLHNQFYANAEVIRLEPAGCKNLMPKIKTGSPFMNWLTLQREEIEDCEVYRSSSRFLNYRQQITNIFGEGGKSGFYHYGTEGGRGPGLKVSPYVHPQLIVLPK